MISGTGKRGFTLLELCIAGSIMGLIATLCWPFLREYTQQISIRNSAEDLAELLREAREKAVLTGKKQTLTPRASPSIVASSSQAVFFPDGSAEPFTTEYSLTNGSRLEIRVEATGRIIIDGG